MTNLEMINEVLNQQGFIVIGAATWSKAKVGEIVKPEDSGLPQEFRIIAPATLTEFIKQIDRFRSLGSTMPPIADRPTYFANKEYFKAVTD